MVRRDESVLRALPGSRAWCLPVNVGYLTLKSRLVHEKHHSSRQASKSPRRQPCARKVIRPRRWSLDPLLSLSVEVVENFDRDGIPGKQNRVAFPRLSVLEETMERNERFGKLDVPPETFELRQVYFDGREERSFRLITIRLISGRRRALSGKVDPVDAEGFLDAGCYIEGDDLARCHATRNYFAHCTRLATTPVNHAKGGAPVHGVDQCIEQSHRGCNRSKARRLRLVLVASPPKRERIDIA